MSAQGLVRRRWNRRKRDLSVDLKEASLEKSILEGIPFSMFQPPPLCTHASEMREQDMPALLSCFLSRSHYRAEVCGAHSIPDQQSWFTVYPFTRPVKDREKHSTTLTLVRGQQCSHCLLPHMVIGFLRQCRSALGPVT